MGMSAKLEVYLLSLSLLQMVGLVVEENGKLAAVSLLHDVGKRLAMLVGSVVPSYDAQIAHSDGSVLQQLDSGLFVELLGFRLPAVVFMIAQTSIYRCIQVLEFLKHLFFL